MRAIVVAFIFLSLPISIWAQADPVNSFGLIAGYGNTFILQFPPPKNDASTDGMHSINLGVTWDHSFSRHLAFKTGLMWHESRVKISSFSPGFELTPVYYKINLVYIPVILKYTFLKYFSLQGGALLDGDLSANSGISSQTGIGATLGAGFSIPILKHFRAELAPYVNLHRIWGLQKENLPSILYDNGAALALQFQL